jgi:hypothetical protein
MKGYKRTSVVLSEDEIARWRRSGWSLQDLIKDGIAVAEADPAGFAAAYVRRPYRRNKAATGKAGEMVPVSLSLSLIPRLEAVKAATGTGLPALVAAGLEALAPGGSGNGAKPASPLAVPFREPGQ